MYRDGLRVCLGTGQAQYIGQLNIDRIIMYRPIDSKHTLQQTP